MRYKIMMINYNKFQKKNLMNLKSFQNLCKIIKMKKYYRTKQKTLVRNLKRKKCKNYHLKRNLNYHHKNVRDAELNCKYKMKIKWVTFKKVNYQNIIIKQKKKANIKQIQNQAGLMSKTTMAMKY